MFKSSSLWRLAGRPSTRPCLQLGSLSPVTPTHRYTLRLVTARFYSPPAEDDPITRYFKSYEGFEYKPEEAYWYQFQRLRKHFEWTRKSEENLKAWAGFQNAVAESFELNFGKDVEDVGVWKKMCETAGVQEIPDDLEECRKAFLSLPVNLVDMHDSRLRGETLKPFSSEAELIQHSNRSKRYFPLNDEVERPVLKFILSEINKRRYSWKQQRKTERAAAKAGKDAEASSETVLKAAEVEN